MQKPISQPCLRNQEAIYLRLKHYFLNPGKVFELACGTAQHAVYICGRLTHLDWQPTDLKPALAGANSWIDDAKLDNLQPAIEFNVSTSDWPKHEFDYIFSANLIHFVTLDVVKEFLSGVEKSLTLNGLLVVYGPFNHQGFTSEGNKNLDSWLKNDIHPQAGIKEFLEIEELAKQYNLTLLENDPMPANNHLLVFKKV